MGGSRWGSYFSALPFGGADSQSGVFVKVSLDDAEISKVQEALLKGKDKHPLAVSRRSGIPLDRLVSAMRDDHVVAAMFLVVKSSQIDGFANRIMAAAERLMREDADADSIRTALEVFQQVSFRPPKESQQGGAHGQVNTMIMFPGAPNPRELVYHENVGGQHFDFSTMNQLEDSDGDPEEHGEVEVDGEQATDILQEQVGGEDS